MKPDGLLRLVRPDAGGRARITGRRIYILPTRYGLVFGVLLISLLVASINYGNNLAFLLTFLLAGIFFQAIFFTWRNLAGLELRLLEPEPAFAGDAARVPVRLEGGGRDRYSLQLGFDQNEPLLLDVPARRPVVARPECRTHRRGLQPCGLLRLETRYPLGLLRAWTRIDPGLEVLAWPRPLESDRLPVQPHAGRGGVVTPRPGMDDFSGHRNYQPGDAPARIHWKALAAGKGLLVKQFTGDPGESRRLDFDALPDADPEVRLRRLAAAVEWCHRRQLRYELRLPGHPLPPGEGPHQRRRCLDALGLFPGPGGSGR